MGCCNSHSTPTSQSFLLSIPNSSSSTSLVYNLFHIINHGTNRRPCSHLRERLFYSAIRPACAAAWVYTSSKLVLGLHEEPIEASRFPSMSQRESVVYDTLRPSQICPEHRLYSMVCNSPTHVHMMLIIIPVPVLVPTHLSDSSSSPD